MASINRRTDHRYEAHIFARNLLLSASFALAVFLPHSAAALFVDVPQLVNGFDCALPDCWLEPLNDDAPGRANPQRTQPDGGGPLQTIFYHGDVGGPLDPADAFTFLLVNANGAGSFFDIFVEFDSFFDVGLFDLPPGPIYPPDEAITNGAFRNIYNGLSAGAYIVEITAPLDPPFTIGVGIINAPPGGGLSFGPAAVPEPATIALLGLGLASLGFARRRKNSA